MRKKSRKAQRQIGSLPAKKKVATKNKSFAIRVQEEHRKLLDKAVAKEKTTITEFVLEPIMEKVDRVLRCDCAAFINFVPDNSNPPIILFKSYFDAICRLKQQRQVFGGFVAAVIISGIVIRQLNK